MVAHLLEVRDLHVSFGSVQAVKGLSFQVQLGEVLAIVGESGSGKSVMARTLLIPEGKVSGDVLFHGENLLTKTKKEMRAIRGKSIGIVFQDPMTALNPTMTIGSQMREMASQHTSLSRQEARIKAVEILREMDVTDPDARLKQYAFELSGGIRQRILIAMAAICKPQLLITDECTTALDVTVQAQILDVLKHLQRTTRMSLLFITHDLSLAAGFADRILIMKEGRAVEIGTVDQIFYEPAHPYTKSLLAHCGGIHASC